jgi:ankyrin repeat protein
MNSMKCLSGSVIATLLLGVVLNATAAPIGLIDAIKKSDTAAVRALLAQKVNVNAAEIDGTTPLHWAAHFENVDAAGQLVRAGADVNVQNRYGSTPLSEACISGNAAMIELLLNAGANANAALPEGETPLMTASRSGNPLAVKLLLAHGADVNAVDAVRGQTALMWAAAEGNTDVVSVLLAGGVDMKKQTAAGFTAFLFAVRNGQMGPVRVMLDAGADVNEILTLANPLTQRRFQNNTRRVEGPTALTLATGNGHFELAAYLLDRGANPNLAAGGRTPLHEITWVRKPGYGENMPAPSGSGNMDSLQLVRKLVAHGADVNARMTKNPILGFNIAETNLPRTGATPFLMAARTADLELMQLLLELGADPTLTNNNKTTPLMAAAGVGNRLPGEDPGSDTEVIEAMKFLIDHGGDVNAVDDNGETAAHGAAYRFFPSAVRFLAEHGVKPETWSNQKNKKGQTPLNIAQGVNRGTGGCLLLSPETEAAIREVLTAAGIKPPEQNVQPGAGEEDEDDQPKRPPRPRVPAGAPPIC